MTRKGETPRTIPLGDSEGEVGGPLARDDGYSRGGLLLQNAKGER
jgi:hypothetical protein